MSPEKQFEKDLEVFRTETDQAAQFLYAFLAVHAVAAEHKTVHRLLNTAPLFWKTNLGALQTSTFIVLGRIFDRKSANNLSRLLRLAQDNHSIFSRESLRRRKQEQSKIALSAEYLRSAHEPSAVDFRRLQEHFDRYRNVYEQKYKVVRHRVFAHKGTSDATTVSGWFAQINIRELERVIRFLRALHEALWQLFINGRRPLISPSRYSVKTSVNARPK